MGLFSGSRTPPAAPPSAPTKTYTNAPKHWPAVTLEPANQQAIQLLILAGALNDGLVAQGAKITEFLRQYVYEDGIPQPRSAREQAEASRLPSADIIAFGLDAIERAAATLQQRPVQRSSAEKLGGPNVDAAIIVRADGRVWQRVLPFDDIAAVMGAAARVPRGLADGGHGGRADGCGHSPGRHGGAARRAARPGPGPGRARRGHVPSLCRRRGGRVHARWPPHRDAAGGIPPAPTPPPIGPYGQPGAELWAMVHTALKLAEKVHGAASAKPDPGRSFEAPHPWPKMPTAMVDRGEAQGTIVNFAMQGPLTALATCPRMLKEDAEAEGIVFWIDDFVQVDGIPDRRLRFYVQRKGDPAAAIIDQRFTTPTDDQPFAFTGQPTFVRWTDSLFV